jgi:hypothetical protein
LQLDGLKQRLAYEAEPVIAQRETLILQHLGIAALDGHRRLPSSDPRSRPRLWDQSGVAAQHADQQRMHPDQNLYEGPRPWTLLSAALRTYLDASLPLLRGHEVPARTERYQFVPWEIEDVNGISRMLLGGYADVTRGGGLEYEQVIFRRPDNTIRAEVHLKRGHTRKLEQFGLASRVLEVAAPNTKSP